MTGSEHLSLPGWTHIYSGKVRDLYIPANTTAAEADRMLVVASDRISAYDYILPTPIPDKGKILTQLSLWWFEQLSDLVANHVISTDVPEAVSGRAMICRRLEMFPIECVARGYLTGSGLVEYRDSKTVCGLSLPAGLTEASRLEAPIFTPAAKAEVGEHDENIDFARCAQMVGQAGAERLRELTLALYTRARDIAAQRGIILADTKFEFGFTPASANKEWEGEPVVLADEVLTPDSSRFWPADKWVEGQVTPSFDKQYVRDWLTGPESGWDRKSGQTPPELPADVVAATRERYLEAYRQLTGCEPKL